ncbi:large ribosomal subunit protein uL13m-like [Artemia franciscana]|uniref:large ribosomal subunit protein uL13m-like n=1 Tax=Artemia franciscana TaxID=6661 RepID=UPI0032DAD342
MSSARRVQQWATMTRKWHLYDATWQDPYKSAEVIVKYLTGRNKPIYAASNDTGDQVVIINTRDIALRGDDWKYNIYFHHTGYAKGASYTPAWEMHKKNPIYIMKYAIYTLLDKDLRRRRDMARLHLFPDSNVPPEVMSNVSSQIPQLRRVPKRLTEFSEEEIRNYPKLFDYPKNYIIR